VAESSDKLRVALLCLVLVLVTLAIYWPVRGQDFVLYDDPEYVCENPTVQKGITTYGLMWCFVDAHAANWHPVTWMSHMIDCQFFGVKPGAHHLVNVAFHCANSALLFLLLRVMTVALWRSVFVAAIFAWHPLRVESVAWISERKDVLSGFFFLLTLLAYARYAKSQVPASHYDVLSPQNQVPGPMSKFSISNSQFPIFTRGQSTFRFPLSCRHFYLLSLVFFTLGLLSKAMLVTVPCVLLLLDFWPLCRLDSAPNAPRLCGVPKALLFEKIPFVVLSLAMGALTFLAQKSGGAVVSLKSEGLSERMANALTSYLGYLGKILWPKDLTVLYLRPQGVSIPALTLATVILLGVSAIVLSNLKSRPYLAVGWFWFVGMLAPVNGLVQLSLQSIADRYTYLPAIGLAIIVVWSLAELRLAPALIPIPRQVVPAAGLIALLVWVALAHCQVAYWKNTETLMVHALEVNPKNYVAHQDLALYYSKIGQTEAAKLHRQRVRELDLDLRQLTTSSH
jgi:hypothetical protein